MAAAFFATHKAIHTVVAAVDFLRKQKEKKEKKESNGVGEGGKEGEGEGGEGEGEKKLLRSFEVVQECLQILYRKIIGKLEGEEREGGRAGRVQEVRFIHTHGIFMIKREN